MNTPETVPGFRSVSGLAVAGFVLSFTVIFSALGVVFSAIGYYQLKNTPPQAPVLGRNLAIWGIVIGSSVTFLWLTALMVNRLSGQSITAALLRLLL